MSVATICHNLKSILLITQRQVNSTAMVMTPASSIPLGLLIVLLIALPVILIGAEDTLRISDYNSSFMGYPDVILIGVQKGGTTSLAYFLVNIKKLYVESWDSKEQHFFSFHFDDAAFNHYISGFEWSRIRHGDLPTFEGSPSYFSFPHTWENMRRLYSPESIRKKKFILTLREPTIRDISWYRHFHGKDIKEQMKDDSPDSELDLHGSFHDYVSSMKASGHMEGDYLSRLKRVLELVHRDQLFILSFEALTGDREVDTLNRLLFFLGHSPIYLRGSVFPKHNTAASFVTTKICTSSSAQI